MSFGTVVRIAISLRVILGHIVDRATNRFPTISGLLLDQSGAYKQSEENERKSKKEKDVFLGKTSKVHFTLRVFGLYLIEVPVSFPDYTTFLDFLQDEKPTLLLL